MGTPTAPWLNNLTESAPKMMKVIPKRISAPPTNTNIAWRRDKWTGILRFGIIKKNNWIFTGRLHFGFISDVYMVDPIFRLNFQNNALLIQQYILVYYCVSCWCLKWHTSFKRKAISPCYPMYFAQCYYLYSKSSITFHAGIYGDVWAVYCTQKVPPMICNVKRCQLSFFLHIVHIIMKSHLCLANFWERVPNLFFTNAPGSIIKCLGNFDLGFQHLNWNKTWQLTVSSRFPNLPKSSCFSLSTSRHTKYTTLIWRGWVLLILVLCSIH